MIQRIQTVYLLIIVALMIATLFLPLTVLQASLYVRLMPLVSQRC